MTDLPPCNKSSVCQIKHSFLKVLIRLKKLFEFWSIIKHGQKMDKFLKCPSYKRVTILQQGVESPCIA